MNGRARDANTGNENPLLHEGSEVVGNTPQEFGNIIKSEVGRWKAVSKAAGIKAE
jgi:tripartite-type tricarboxylate transporter receptor subunit TctC